MDLTGYRNGLPGWLRRAFPIGVWLAASVLSVVLGGAGCNSDPSAAMSGQDLGASSDAGSTVDASSAPPVPYCAVSCKQPTDCVDPRITSGPYSASHYACQMGACAYTGCLSDTECSSYIAGTLCIAAAANTAPLCNNTCTTDNDCQMRLGSAKYVCRPSARPSASLCFATCKTPADCAGTGAVYAADHYDCVNSMCQYKGCRSDTECMTLNQQGYTYVCKSP